MEGVWYQCVSASIHINTLITTLNCFHHPHHHLRTTVQSLNSSSNINCLICRPQAISARFQSKSHYPSTSALLSSSIKYQSLFLKHSNKHVFLRPTNIRLRWSQMGTIPSTLQQGVPNGRNMRHEVDIRSISCCQQVPDVQEVRSHLAQDCLSQGASGPMGNRKHQPCVDG